jgi:putative FmdB family regulatory protein
MPTYDYRCEANGRRVEVMHKMSEQMNTWGQLCEKAGIEPGDTPVEAPVTRLATGGNLISSSSLSSGEAPACNTGACCPGGMCGLN